MRADELAGNVPGYRVTGISDLGGRTVLALVNEASGERFVIDAVRLDQLTETGPQSLGKRISEDLAVFTAGLALEGVRRVDFQQETGSSEAGVLAV